MPDPTRTTPNPPPSAHTPRQPTTALDNAVTEAISGNPEAFRYLYCTLQPRLLSYLQAIVGATHAEDIASETWARIAGSLHTFTGTGNDFRAWTITIARHRAIDHLRRQRHTTPMPPHALPDQLASNDTERDALTALSTAATLALIAQLPTRQAQAILLRIIFGLDGKTTGIVLGKQPNAIHTATNRGLHHLAQLLQSAST